MSALQSKIAVYYRVSTESQDTDMQRHAVKEWLEKNPEYQGAEIYEDIGISGASEKRPAFQALLTACEYGDITTVIVYKLDRLTRNALVGIKTLLRFDEIGVEFISVTQPMFSAGTPFRHAIIAIFAELAQMERETLRERIATGLSAARKRGVKLGPPTKVTDETRATVRRLRDQGATYKTIANQVGLSLGTVYKIYNQRGKAS